MDRDGRLIPVHGLYRAVFRVEAGAWQIDRELRGVVKAPTRAHSWAEQAAVALLRVLVREHGL